MPNTTEQLSLSPAARLLFLTTAVRPDPQALRELLTEDLDWGELCVVASQERAAATLVQHLGADGAEAAGPGYEDLRTLATGSVMRMLYLEQLLHQVVAELAALGIDIMLLKGAGLACTAYPSFSDRPMGDLDVLIASPDTTRAWRHLQNVGWEWPESRWNASRYTEHQHLPPLIRQPGDCRLEVHGDLLPGGHPFVISSETLRERGRKITINDCVVTVPDTIHLLWHTCVHFAWQHEMQWGGWRAVRDVAFIVEHEKVPWPEFVEFARDTRAATVCYWTLRLAHLVADAAIPDEVLSALSPPGAPSILDGLERHYVWGIFPSTRACPSDWLSHRLWEAGVRPGWSDHGKARPWHTSERWLRELEGSDGDQLGEERRWNRVWRVGGWWSYLWRVFRKSTLAST